MRNLNLTSVVLARLKKNNVRSSATRLSTYEKKVMCEVPLRA